MKWWFFIDKVTKLEKGKFATGIKEINKLDNIVLDSIAISPTIPKVLHIEALAQLGAILIVQSLKTDDGKSVMPILTMIEQTEFNDSNIECHQIEFWAQISKLEYNFASIDGKAFSNGKLILKSRLVFVYNALEDVVEDDQYNYMQEYINEKLKMIM